MRARGLKQGTDEWTALRLGSRPMRARGLKLPEPDKHVACLSSRPMRARGLKRDVHIHPPSIF